MSIVAEILGPEEGKTFDARTFLEFLDRSADRWWPDESSHSSPWVFRGQRDATWKVIPSAARPEAALSKEFLSIVRGARNEFADKIPQWNEVPQKTQEIFVRGLAATRCARSFLDLATDLGLEMTGGCLRSLVNDVYFFREFRARQRVVELAPWVFGWHQNQISPLHALAQHHGVPTYLLDWTRDPLAACFFAAEKAQTDLAVWALDPRFIADDTIRRLELRLPNQQPGPGLLKFGRPSTMGNQFLSAQSGFFTAIPFLDFSRPAEFPALDDHLQGLDSALAESVSDGEDPDRLAFRKMLAATPILKKVVLGKKEVPKLRTLLFRQGYSKAHLMPTLDNVREIVMEQLGASYRE